MKTWKEDENNEDEPFKIKLDNLLCNNRFRGMSIYNPSSKHLGMSNCMRNQNEFKKLPTHWDTISKMTSIHKFPTDVVKDFLRLLKEMLQVNKMKSTLLSCVDQLNHRVRFEFYSCSTLLEDTSTRMEHTRLPNIDLNNLLVSVNRNSFFEYQNRELTLVTDPIAMFVKTCYEKELDELKKFFFSLTPDQFTTLSFCIERSVEMMNLIGFTGRISTKMKQHMLANPSSTCIPGTNLPSPFFKTLVSNSRSNYALFVKR